MRLLHMSHKIETAYLHYIIDFIFVRKPARQLPLRGLGWAFPDEGTAALLLENLGNLVLRYRPPHLILTLENGRVEGEAKTPFQRLLEVRCQGRLLRLEH